MSETTFTILLDDITTHPTRTPAATVEESIAWLFNHCDNQPNQAAAKTTKAPPRRVSWMNGRSSAAAKEPPVLVLFGVSYPFICRLTKVDVVTKFQSMTRSSEGKPTVTTSQADNPFSSQQELERHRSANALRYTDSIFHIERALVSITLVEYNAAPQTEDKKA